MRKSDASHSPDFEDFRFRRRHDHLLRYRLRGAKPEDVIQVAHELGFNLTLEDLRIEKHKTNKN